MVATIETLPNEVLEIIFSKLGGVPKLPVPGWRMLDEPVWVNNAKDVVNLSCASKRFCTVGQDHRQSVMSLQQHKKTDLGAKILHKFETKTMSTVKLLSVHLRADDMAAATARLLGERIQMLAALKHLDMRFAYPSSARLRSCCGADREFLDSIIANVALDGYELSSFRYDLSKHYMCSHIRVWQVVAKLKVRDLALDSCPEDDSGVQCPIVRQLAIGCDKDVALSTIWRSVNNVEEIWIFDDYNMKRVEFWGRPPASVHTLGISGCKTVDLETVMTALINGEFGGLRRFVSGLLHRDSPEPLEEKRARKKVMRDIDTALRARGGTAGVLDLEEQEGSEDASEEGESGEVSSDAGSESDGH